MFSATARPWTTRPASRTIHLGASNQPSWPTGHLLLANGPLARSPVRKNKEPLSANYRPDSALLEELKWPASSSRLPLTLIGRSNLLATSARVSPVSPLRRSPPLRPSSKQNDSFRSRAISRSRAEPPNRFSGGQFARLPEILIVPPSPRTFPRNVHRRPTSRIWIGQI